MVVPKIRPESLLSTSFPINFSLIQPFSAVWFIFFEVLLSKSLLNVDSGTIQSR